MTFPGEFLLATVVSSLVQSALEPVARAINHGVNKAIPNQFPFWQNVIELRWRNQLNKDQYQAIMQALGFSEPLAESMYLAGRQPFSVADTVNLHRRELIPDTDYGAYMSEAGISSDRIPVAENALRYYPPVQDLIRFQVREAYNNEIVKLFELDSGEKTTYYVEAAKAGLDKDTSDYYWRAHWELPSINMGYEMLHRSIISLDQLKLLLRTQDVMPFWADKLIKISFAPYTRVDVRRMFKLGILTPEQVLRAYLDIGYDQEHAENLTEFTIRDVAEEERDLTRTDIVQLYTFKELTLEQATGMLVKLGYDATEAEAVLSLADAKLKKQDTSDTIKVLTQRFIDGAIEQEELQSELNTMGLAGTAIERILGEALKKRKASEKNLSKEDIKALFSAEIISEQEVFDRLKFLNFHEDDAALLVELWKSKAGGGG